MSRKGIVKNGGRGNDLLVGTDRDDRLSGGNGNDQVYGGRGDDRLDGDAGNDILDGGGGSDRVDGGSGNDLLIYVARENRGDRDDYDGGSGSDTLRLVLTRDEWMRSAVQSDLARYLTFVDSHTNRKGEADGHTFRFSAFDLKATKFEKVEVIVDGASLNPRDQAVDARDDAARVGEDEARVTGNVLRGAGADIVPDLVRSIQLIAGPAGGTISRDAAGNYTYAGSGHGTLKLDAAGNFTYTPGTVFNGLNQGQTATETFRYRLTDADGDTDEARITITIVGSNDGIFGTAGNDTLTGTPGNDEIFGLGGNDQIDGLAGNDRLDGGDGNDRLIDSQGNNQYFGGAGDDVIEFFNFAGVGTALMDGGDGNDSISALGLASVNITGGAGRDDVGVAGTAAVTVDLGEGDDFLRMGGATSAIVFLGAGNDNVTVDNGAGTIDAGTGNDQIVMRYSGIAQTVATGAGRDFVVPIEFGANGLTITDFTPGPDGDILEYSNLNTLLVGWNGTSNPFGTGHLRLSQVGDDTVFGIDIDGAANGQSYVSAIVLKNVPLASLTATNFGPSYDLTGLPGATLVGSSGNDHLRAGEGNDRLDGRGGDDILDAFGGNDYLEDNQGNNVFRAGAGDDQVFSTGSTGATVDLGEGNNFTQIQQSGSVHVTAGGGNDEINIYLSADTTIEAGAGDNVIRSPSSTGNHNIITGGGSDYILFIGNGFVDSGDGGDTVDVGGADGVNLGAGDDRVAIHTPVGGISLGTGTDRVFMTVSQSFAGAIFEFTAEAGGDVLDMRSLILATPTASNIHDFLDLRNDSFGTSTILSWDVDGAGTEYGRVDLLRLAGLTNLDVDAFYANGNLVA